MEGVSECLCRNVILLKFLYAGTRVRGSASTSNSVALNAQISRSECARNLNIERDSATARNRVITKLKLLNVALKEAHSAIHCHWKQAIHWM